MEDRITASSKVRDSVVLSPKDQTVLQPDTHHGVWMLYRNAKDNKSGVPSGLEIVVSSDEPQGIDDSHWAKIGAFSTNKDGNIFFYKSEKT